MDYTIIVNDNGELKTISATEMERYASNSTDFGSDQHTAVFTLNDVINSILDARMHVEALGADANCYKGTADQRVADDTEHANRGQR